MEVKIKKVLSGFLREWSQAPGMLSGSAIHLFLRVTWPLICFLLSLLWHACQPYPASTLFQFQAYNRES